jgi:16S rRNA (guanine527-N7)-methyltransferase
VVNVLSHEPEHPVQAALSPSQGEALERYLDLLLAANQRMNLTRITDREQARIQHIADAMTLLPHLPPAPHRLADVGSGGGVPGIPLAIARPNADVTLIESVAKKAAFLEETAAALGLANITVWRGRAEEWRGEPFDVVAVRAVAPMAKLLDWCRPLVAPGGKLLAMKGPKLAEELEAAGGVIQRQGASVRVHAVGQEGLAGHVIAEARWPDRARKVE